MVCDGVMERYIFERPDDDDDDDDDDADDVLLTFEQRQQIRIKKLPTKVRRCQGRCGPINNASMCHLLGHVTVYVRSI